MKMNPKIKAQWVAALRSGKIKQARGQLRKGDAMCCLGVLCNLHAQAHPEIAAQQQVKSKYMGNYGSLPNEVAEWAGLRDRFVTIGNETDGLAIHNDNGRTFAQIADAIEAQL